MIIPAGFGEATFVFIGPALPTGAVCSLGFADVTDNGPQQAADDIATQFTADVLPLLGDDVTLQKVIAKLGPNDTGPAAEAVVNEPGSESASIATPNVCYLIRKTTALGGREQRGRMFLPGVVEGQVGSDGAVDGLTVSAFESAFESFLTGLLGAGYPAVLLHNDPGTGPTEITSMYCDSRAATQRRRLRR